MKTTMVIPSYWTRESSIGWKEGDFVYDHPTPLDMEGTLQRAIESIGILNDKDFRLVVIAAPTSEDIGDEVEKKVADIIRSAAPTAGVEVLLFGPSHLKQIHDMLIGAGKNDSADLLKLEGYSNIRNLCMFIPHIMGSDIAVLIDDDEVFEDPEFMSKAREFIGNKFEGETVNAVAGYYLQHDGDYHANKPSRPWMKYWDKNECMNEAFDQVIGTEPRLKETPFVFGGNMVVHRNMFTVVPFDPMVPRGEDIDFLMNAKMFGFKFYLDNKLSIKHLPPLKTHFTWKQLREDIYRFVYERAKIRDQVDVKGMTRILPEDFDPYPGCFLKNDLEEKIKMSCELLSKDYLAEGDSMCSEATLGNITIAKTDAEPDNNPFLHLCKLQKRWQGMMEYTGKDDVSSGIKAIIEGK